MAYRFNPFSRKLDLVSDVLEGAALPGSGSNGDMFFNTTSSTLYIYYNDWIAVGAGVSGPTTAFYQEDGTSFILAEDSSYLLQEA